MKNEKSEVFGTKQDYFFDWLDEWLKPYSLYGVKIKSSNPSVISMIAFLYKPKMYKNTFAVCGNVTKEELDKDPYDEFLGDVFVFTVLPLSDTRVQVDAKCFAYVQELVDVFNSVWNEILLTFEKIPRVQTERGKNEVESIDFQPASDDVAQVIEPAKPALPEIQDPTDQRIWEWVKKDPSITDTDIAQKLVTSRQSVNARRRALEKMGYPVRKMSRH